MKAYNISKLLFIFTLAFILNSCFKNDLLKEIDALKMQVSTIQKRNDSLNNVLNVRADSLSKALSNAQKRSDSLSNILRTKSDSLSQALGLTNANLANLSKSVDSIKAQIANITGQLTQLNIQLTSITSQLSQLNQQLGALGGDISQLTAQYQALSASLQTINTQIAALQAEQLKLLDKLNVILLQLNPPTPPILESLKQGLVAYYPFSGNAGDSSGNGNHGTNINTLSFTTNHKGVANSALNMVGGSNGGRITTNSNVFQFQYADNYTLAFWFLERAVSNNGRLLSTENPEGAFRIASYRNGAYAISLGPEPYLYDTVALNTWNHIVFTFRNGTGQLFKNGKLKSELQFPNSGIIRHNVFTIGTKAAPAYDAWNGSLDELRIYNRVLTQQEITYLSNN